MALLLVHDEGVALAVGVEANALPQVGHHGEVLDPEPVDGLEHDGAFDGAHCLSAVVLFPLLIEGLGGGEQLVLGLRGAIAEQGIGVEPVGEGHDDADACEERLDLPLLRFAGEVGLHESRDLLADHLLDVDPEVGSFQHLVPLRVDDLPLAVDHVVVLDEVFADVEEVGLRLALGHLEALGEHAALQRGVFGERLAHEAAHHAAGEPGEDVVLQRAVEARLARVALASGASAELVVYAARFVALGADDVEAPFGYDVFVRVLPRAGLRLRRRVAAEDDVRAASRHVGGDGDRAGLPRLRHDLRLALVVLCVQHLVLDAASAEQAAELLRTLDRRRADEHGPAVRVELFDVVCDGAELGGVRLEHEIRVVLPDHGSVGGDGEHFQLVDLEELLRFREGGAGHASQFGVHAEVVLERDGGVGDGLPLDLDALLRLDRLVEALAVTASGHEAAGELVDDDDLAVPDDVVPVALVDELRAQRVLHEVGEDRVGRVVEVADVEERLDLRDARVGEQGLPLLLGDGEILFLAQAGDDAGDRAVERR